MNEINKNLKALRSEMELLNLDAVYISGTDPHSSEYIPDYWKTRAFISGFTGSFGVIVVTKTQAKLWTDSRYFIQAEEELKDTEFEMEKLRVKHAVLPESWLFENLAPNSKLGIDAQTVSHFTYKSFQFLFNKKNISIVSINHIFQKIWKNRPSQNAHPIYELELETTGKSRKKKHAELILKLKNLNADGFVISMLDELAWFFNLRGNDINYNPVFLGFAYVEKKLCHLFIQENTLNESLKNKLISEGIKIYNYTSFYSFLNEIKGKNILIDSSTANAKICKTLISNNKLIENPSPLALSKAIKNKTEINGFKKAMVKDGVALLEFLFWLNNNLRKKEISEFIVGQKLKAFRSKQEGFKGESFPPIVGYKHHGAIVHLSVSEQNALALENKGILLFDSGAQYLQGTTDITRTVALGAVSEQQKTDFTLVLKGMIGLTQAKFPEGTKGCHIDILARKALWENGLNYGHGTGHGVGHFLNVHEGPMSIRQEFNNIALQPGMVFSNEPAFYREGEYGIRIENLMVCVDKEETFYGKFYGFETLTLCPIDTSLIRKELCSEQEIDWLNNYHKRVYLELSPYLNSDLNEFLKKLTALI